MNPLINILIRTHRPELLKRCKQSVINDNYPGELQMLYYFDEDYKGDRSIPFFYNLFCNTLIQRVNSGYILFIDDDDVLIPGALLQIAKYLEEDRPVICQMLRDGKKKPGDVYMDKGVVDRGRIGMPCMILHSKHKDLYTFEATEDTDYQWIKTVSETLKCKFVKIPVVDAGRRSYGV